MHRDRRGQPKLIRNTKRQIINTRVDPDRWSELRRIALDQKRTAADVLNDAIDLYLEKAKG
jgi:hypothetical protein